MQTGEGALNEVSNILLRLRELAVQASNGSMSSNDRKTLDDEFSELVSEIDRIGRGTEFNGIRLLDGSSPTLNLQIGLGTQAGIDTLAVGLDAVLATSLGLDVAAITNVATARASMDAIDLAIDQVSRSRGRFGAMQGRLESSIRFLGLRAENLAAAESRIRDADLARETAEMARDQILQQASIAVLAQANAQPQLMLRLLSNG